MKQVPTSMGNRRKTYKRARRCPVTGVKLASVYPEFLTYGRDRVAKATVAEETGDQTLIDDVGGTIVGPKEWRRETPITCKHLDRVAQESGYHCYNVAIGEYPSGKSLMVRVSHVDTVQYNNASRW